MTKNICCIVRLLSRRESRDQTPTNQIGADVVSIIWLSCLKCQVPLQLLDSRVQLYGSKLGNDDHTNVENPRSVVLCWNSTINWKFSHCYIHTLCGQKLWFLRDNSSQQWGFYFFKEDKIFVKRCITQKTKCWSNRNLSWLQLSFKSSYSRWVVGLDCEESSSHCAFFLIQHIESTDCCSLPSIKIEL